LVRELTAAYEGYPVMALLLFGVAWLVATLVAAVALSWHPWSSKRLRREHQPQEDHLLT
jgi:hypothetical protein